MSALLGFGFVCLCIVPVIRKHKEQTRTLPGQARTVPRKGEDRRESRQLRKLWVPQFTRVQQERAPGSGR